MEKEHTHWGIWIAIVILFILILVNSSSLFRVEKETNQELPEQDAIFIFDEEKIRFFNEEGDLLESYDYIKIYPGLILNLDIIIESEEEILCIEHQFKDVHIGEGYEVPVPEEYITENYKYDVQCFVLDKNRNYIIIEQRWDIQEESQYVKLQINDKR